MACEFLLDWIWFIHGLICHQFRDRFGAEVAWQPHAWALILGMQGARFKPAPRGIGMQKAQREKIK